MTLNIRNVVKLRKRGRLDKSLAWDNISGDVIKLFSCSSCVLGKGTQLPSPPSSLRTSSLVAVPHVDIWGPARIPSLGGHSYLLTCVDDFSRKLYAGFLQHRSDAVIYILNLITNVETQLSTRVKVICSDSGGKFAGRSFLTAPAAKGIIEHHVTPPAAHAQNGRWSLPTTLSLMVSVPFYKLLGCRTDSGPRLLRTQSKLGIEPLWSCRTDTPNKTFGEDTPFLFL